MVQEGAQRTFLDLGFIYFTSYIIENHLICIGLHRKLFKMQALATIGSESYSKNANE